MRNAKEIFETLKDIISQEMGAKKVYDKDLAIFLGIKQLTLATMKKRGRIPYEKILDFCAKRNISINWLLYDQSVDTTRDETEKYARIKYFSDIYASAGGGAINYEENCEYLKIDEKIIEKLNCTIAEARHIEIISVSGESMEPTLKDGDMVFINKNKKDIQKGGIFVLLTENGLFIKRVVYKMNGQFDIVSDNPVYPVETISCDSFTVIGEVMGAIHRF